MANTTPLYHPKSDYDQINRQLLFMAGESSVSESADRVGVTAHARSGYLDLAASLSVLPDASQVKEIEIYADTLDATTKVSLSAQINTLTVFARQIKVAQQMVIEVHGDTLIELYCSSACSFPVRVRMPNDSVTVAVKLPAGVKGISIEVHGNDWTVDNSPINESLIDRFKVPSVVDQIQDNGELAKAGIDAMNDHLPKLFAYQLILAATWQQRHPEAAFDSASFVAKLSRGAPNAFDLYSRGFALAAACGTIGTGQLAAQVPLVAPVSIKQVLKSHLLSAKAFEDAFRDFRGQQIDSQNLISSAQLALAASEDAKNSYAFLAKMARARYDAALESLKTAQAMLQDLEANEVVAAQKEFREGIEEWKKRKIRELVIQGISAIVTIGGSIAAACVAPPAGAEGLAAAVELPEITKEAADGIVAVEEMITIWDRIKALFTRMKPMLEKIGDVAEKVAAILLTLRTLERVSNIATATINLEVPVDYSQDIINLQADWDSFGAEMESLSRPIFIEKIGGADRFFLAMAKVVIRGKATLAAQQAVTATGDALATVLTQELLSQNQSARLRAAIPLIQKNVDAVRLVKLNLFQRLLFIRSSIVMDFKSYLDGYAWYALDIPPVALDPLKEIGDFYNDAATLQAAFAQSAAALHPQKRVFYLSTSLSGSEWAASRRNPGPLPVTILPKLKNAKEATFVIDPQLACFTNLTRVRLRSFRIFLDGVNSSNAMISMRVRLGETMSDIGVNSLVVHFVAEPTTYGFAYTVDTNDGTVVMDGELGDETVWPSPFRTWTIRVDDRVDIRDLSTIRLVMTCSCSILPLA